MRKLIALALLLCVTAALTAVAKAQLGGAVHEPGLSYVEGVAYEDGDWKWSDAETGTVKGEINFSRRRPRQPVVVYLVRLGDDGKPGEQGLFDVAETVEVSQKGGKFAPSFAVLMRKQKLKFLNDEEEEISHNVYFLGDIEIDLGIFGQGESREHTFDEAGEVSVHCSIHRRMDGKVYVAPNPAYAVLEFEDDSFEIEDVPAGSYELRTWQKQKRFKEFRQVIEVEADGNVDVIVEMTR